MTHNPPTTTQDELADCWLRLWNGEYDLAGSIIAADFRLHAALLGATSDDAVHGAETLTGWIAATRTAVEDLRFTIEVGPLIDADGMALRWRAHGHYSGGFPGATAAPGTPSTPIEFTDTDLLRVQDQRIAEYWVNSDMHVLLEQLAVRTA